MATQIRGIEAAKIALGYMPSLEVGDWIYPEETFIVDDGNGPFAQAKAAAAGSRSCVVTTPWDGALGISCVVYPRTTVAQKDDNPDAIHCAPHPLGHFSRCRVDREGWVICVPCSVALAPVGDAGDANELWCCEEPAATPLFRELKERRGAPRRQQ